MPLHKEASAGGATTEEHLVCGRCSVIVNVCRLDGVAHLVCHCTHVDGEIAPVEVYQTAALPDRWEWRQNGRKASSTGGDDVR